MINRTFGKQKNAFEILKEVEKTDEIWINNKW